MGVSAMQAGFFLNPIRDNDTIPAFGNPFHQESPLAFQAGLSRKERPEFRLNSTRAVGGVRLSGRLQTVIEEPHDRHA
jgi:hypothetical protein